MTFFQKVNFIEKCSVIQNTFFQYVKNNFLLAQKKLIFFTILDLPIVHVHYKICVPKHKKISLILLVIVRAPSWDLNVWCLVLEDQRSRVLEILFCVAWSRFSGKYKHNFWELQPRMEMGELSTIHNQNKTMYSAESLQINLRWALRSQWLFGGGAHKAFVN